jgi:hypothetical protein
MVVAPGMVRAELAKPKGPVLLTVSGSIELTNAEGEARFDAEGLSEIGFSEIRTRTPWTDGEPVFEGVLARDLMRTVGAKGTSVRAVAINDYEAVIPLSDFARYDVLLAMRMDGEPLRVRDRGPLWIVYPWSQTPGLDSPETRSRAVWQLSRLVIE